MKKRFKYFRQTNRLKRKKSNARKKMNKRSLKKFHLKYRTCTKRDVESYEKEEFFAFVEIYNENSFFLVLKKKSVSHI